MRKAIKKIAMPFVICGLMVSVSFGAWIAPYHESRYQKLKAEVAEYGNAEECKWSEDGKKIISESVDWRLCKVQKVVLFFDEIRATEVKGAKTEYDEFAIAMRKVMEMPRFKEDSGIYGRIITFDGNRKAGFRSEKGFWEDVWNKWDLTKIDLEMDGARRDYWKKLAE